ncbi:N-acyl amino acid synthase FeeM domain-containing protein [Vibrio sp. MA40-2]|uniref:N-acyl amino acid synthase FeeM domain-containing protein n=1 Tax=Vibrio sp. MA40-2 TaxID=3391828 RepID=UPI0039A6D2FC
MINTHTKAPELNGRNVPVERRKDVRISKDSTKDKPEVRAVTYKIAVEKQELEKAFSLVWENYVETGLQQNDNLGLRFTKYHLLPDTRVFIANFHEELADQKPEKYTGKGICVGTVTLVMDGPMGLPMEEFCGEAIDKMRKEGRKVAEVVAFAVDPKYTKHKIFLHMFKLLFQFAAMKGVTDICCSVTERHIRFYRRVCLFEPIGELTPYSAAYKHRVQGHRLDISQAKKKAEEFYGGREFDADLFRFFFGETYNRQKGEGKPLSEENIEYFANKKTKFIETLEGQELDVLRSEYNKVGMSFPF